jgi:SPP1 family predicted phage head-tail adaptor
MRAGKLDRRIRIESKSATLDSYGQEVISWVLVDEVWAEIDPKRGNEIMASMQTTPEATKIFRIRYLSTVNENCRIVYRSEAYDIKYIAEIGRQEGMEITAQKPFPVQ